MSKYYLDYENFATRKERVIRKYATEDGMHSDALEGQMAAKNKFLRKLNLPINTKLKGDIGGYRGAVKLSRDRVVKNFKLGLGGQATWAERKAARTERYNKKSERKALNKKRNHILKHAVISD